MYTVCICLWIYWDALKFKQLYKWTENFNIWAALPSLILLRPPGSHFPFLNCLTYILLYLAFPLDSIYGWTWEILNFLSPTFGLTWWSAIVQIFYKWIQSLWLNTPPPVFVCICMFIMFSLFLHLSMFRIIPYLRYQEFTRLIEYIALCFGGSFEKLANLISLRAFSPTNFSLLWWHNKQLTLPVYF